MHRRMLKHPRACADWTHPREAERFFAAGVGGWEQLACQLRQDHVWLQAAVRVWPRAQHDGLARLSACRALRPGAAAGLWQRRIDAGPAEAAFVHVNDQGMTLG